MILIVVLVVSNGSAGNVITSGTAAALNTDTLEYVPYSNCSLIATTLNLYLAKAVTPVFLLKVSPFPVYMRAQFSTLDTPTPSTKSQYS